MIMKNTTWDSHPHKPIFRNISAGIVKVRVLRPIVYIPVERYIATKKKRSITFLNDTYHQVLYTDAPVCTMLLKCYHCGKETSWNPCENEEDAIISNKSVAAEHQGAHNKGDNDKEKCWFRDNIPKVLMIAGAVVALPCLAASAVGFGAAGIVGGSLAAATQSAIGNVAAGSAFAIFQSLGATGVFVNGAAAGAAAVGAGAAVSVMSKDKKAGDKQGDDDNGSADEDSKKASNTNNHIESGALGTWMKCDHCGKRFFVDGSQPSHL